MQLQLLEEKHSLSRRHLGKNTEKKSQEEEEGDQCKSLSYVLDEVQHKGTLMERLTILENRVLQVFKFRISSFFIFFLQNIYFDPKGQRRKMAFNPKSY